MWVVPKNNSAQYDIRVDQTPYLNNAIDIEMITKNFNMTAYIESGNVDS
jgi:hypothetical protein